MFRTRALLVVLTCAVAMAACSDDAPSETTTATPAEASVDAPSFPRQVHGITIPAAPMRIVSASATHTEMLFAMGLGDRVVAVDLFSDHPAEVADKERIDAFNLNVEAVASLEPDLVILSFDPGDAASALATLGIPTILFPTAPASLDGAYAEMEVVGMATGADLEADDLIAGIRAEVDEMVSLVAVSDPRPTYYHELGEDLYSITSSTFIGTIYTLLGLENIADPADDAGFGYPQLSAEYILEADPDFIFLADTVCCAQSIESLASRPGWDTLSAVRNGRVIELDDSVASRWGPRIVDFLSEVTSAVYEMAG
jgi:iron complex transport system substrate-binding protein